MFWRSHSDHFWNSFSKKHLGRWFLLLLEHERARREREREMRKKKEREWERESEKNYQLESVLLLGPLCSVFCRSGPLGPGSWRLARSGHWRGIFLTKLVNINVLTHTHTHTYPQLHAHAHLFTSSGSDTRTNIYIYIHSLAHVHKHIHVLNHTCVLFQAQTPLWIKLFTFER